MAPRFETGHDRHERSDYLRTGSLVVSNMRTLLAAIVITNLLSGSSAIAESTKEAMSAFGMLGTWSLDCARPSRVVYATPLFGAPTITSVANGKEGGLSEVQEAFRVTAEKIKLQLIIRKAPGALDWMPQPGEIWEAVYEKSGNKFRPLSVRQKDGPKITAQDGFYYVPKNSGMLTLPFEKCLN